MTARQHSLLVEPGGYSEATRLIEALQGQGIEANVTVGGVVIQTPDDASRTLAFVTCQSFGLVATTDSLTSLQDRILHRQDPL